MNVLILCGLVAAAGGPLQTTAKPVPVRVVAENGRFQLQRGGKPYVVKGAGGDGSLALLAKMGGNSMRTWGADRLGEILDEAARNGLTVTAGIWLGHERHGFRYDDPAQVARQKENVRQVVEKYRGHPALLIWALGNEMEGDGSKEIIWRAVNDLAVMVKQLDPNHPTMTVIAEVGGDKVKNLHRFCPAVDIVGINSYAGASSVARRYVAAGGTKPFILTEFGPPGTWEVPKTPWGAPIEPTSTEKAEWYRNAWTANVGESPLCLGGYAFTWGHKQETTATWFGMLLPDGSQLESVHAMSTLWTGKPPSNACPRISRLAVDGAAEVDPGAMVRATLDASDPDGDPLTVRWELRSEATQTGVGGEAEAVPAEEKGAVLEGDVKDARVRMPQKLGGYRLFVYVRDGKGCAATGNIPLLVKGAALPGKKAQLPLIIYGDAGQGGMPYAASGWMGNTAAISVEDSAIQPASGRTCLRCAYAASDGWGGVVWQDPPNDWGDKPGGYDLRGAKRLTWKARGDVGGEIVTFLFGLLGPDKMYSDTTQMKLENVHLTRDWQAFSMDLSRSDLTRIKTGFGWTVAGQGRPIVFYLDDITVE